MITGQEASFYRCSVEFKNERIVLLQKLSVKIVAGALSSPVCSGYIAEQSRYCNIKLLFYFKKDHVKSSHCPDRIV